MDVEIYDILCKAVKSFSQATEVQYFNRIDPMLIVVYYDFKRIFSEW